MAFWFVRKGACCGVYTPHSLAAGRAQVCCSCAWLSAPYWLCAVGLWLWRDPPLNITITSAILMGLGILLILGLWTPIVGTLVALVEAWKILTLSGDRWLWLLLGAVSAALAMLGPGLWSIDARLFGWKRVEAPPRRSKF